MPQAYYISAAFEKTKKAGRREFLRARYLIIKWRYLNRKDLA